MEVSIETAYREACLALGEALVRERLLAANIAALVAAARPAPPPEPPPAQP